MACSELYSINLCADALIQDLLHARKKQSTTHGFVWFFSVACRTLGALLMFGRLQSSSPLYRYVSL